jgi:hypothetical protein
VGLFASFLENQKSESTPANSANPANLPSHPAQNSQLSRDSQVATLKAEIAGQRKFATFATGKSENAVLEGPVDAQPQPVETELEERKGMAMAGVPEPYLDTWARLQCHPPMGAPNEEWRQAIDDAGRFLDQWGSRAVEFGWTAGDLFDVPRDGKPGGLVWFLGGESVQAIGPRRPDGLSSGESPPPPLSIGVT